MIWDFRVTSWDILGPLGAIWGPLGSILGPQSICMTDCQTREELATLPSLRSVAKYNWAPAGQRLGTGRATQQDPEQTKSWFSH